MTPNLKLRNRSIDAAYRCLAASLCTSNAVEAKLGMEVLGVERRRRWTDAAKLGIHAEVNTDVWTLADVARGHDLTRRHLYQWRRELRVTGS